MLFWIKPNKITVNLVFGYIFRIIGTSYSMINKQSWVYAGKLKRHTIELAHAPASNKVYIRLNGIALYEEVINPNERLKTFSFFVDDELCQVTIEKVDNHFEYRFASPERSTSTTSKRRRLKDLLFIVGIITIFAGIVGGLGVPFVYQALHTQQLNRNLDFGGMVTTAYLQLTPQTGDYYLTDYTYRAGLHQLTTQKKISLQDSSLMALQTMFGKQAELSVEALYAATEPATHRLLLAQPSGKQIETYRQAARKVCQTLQWEGIAGNYEQEVFCDCLLTYFFTHYDIEGYAWLYNAKKTPAENATYNEQSVTKFMTKSLPAEIAALCRREAAAN